MLYCPEREIFFFFFECPTYDREIGSVDPIDILWLTPVESIKPDGVYLFAKCTLVNEYWETEYDDCYDRLEN